MTHRQNIVYKPIPLSERKPVKPGWFNLVCDLSPTACGRAFFDGTKFKFENKCHDWSRLLQDGDAIYWLEGRWED